MSKRSSRLLLLDILEAVNKIEQYTDGLTVKDFLSDEKTADAVVRNLEIICEAANRISTEEKQQYRNIEWQQIVGLRHRIVHDYFGIDLMLIWQICKNDIPIF